MTETSAAEETRRSLQPPRLVAWVAVAICLAGTVMVLVGAWRIGIWTDEPAHVIRYANLQEHGWYLLDDDFDDAGEPGEWVTDRYVYAPVTTELMHGVNRVLGLDPAGGLGSSVRAFSSRHLVVAALGLLGVLAVAVTARRLLGSWAWGAVAGATLMAIPMWPGLSMFDIKDVPAATGYTLVTLGLVELLLSTHPQRARWWTSTWPVAVLAAGLLLAVGTRPGLWPGLAASLLGAVAAAWLLPGPAGADGRRTRVVRVLVSVAVAGVVAYAVLLLSYPAYFSRPDRWLLGAVGDSAQYVGTATVAAPGSWAYVPSRVVALVMPPALLLGGVAGLAIVLWRRPKPSPELGGWLLVTSQALLLPVLAMVRESSLGDDLRQLTFSVPAVALLLTLGWRGVASTVTGGAALARRVAAVVWSTVLLVPVAVQVQMFPFGYSYAAPQADAMGAIVQDDWARLSLRELLPAVPRDEYVACTTRNSDRGYTPRTVVDCATDPYATLTPFGLAEPSRGDDVHVDRTFVAVFTRGLRPGSNCRELGRVERPRYLGTAVLSRVARCDLVLEPYPLSGVDLGADGLGHEYLLDGWTSRPTYPGVELRGPAGSIGVQLPDGWSGKALTVNLTGRSPETPEVLVNNLPVPVTVVDGGWRVDVPSETAGAMGEDRLVVTVLGQDERLALERLTVERAGATS